MRKTLLVIVLFVDDDDDVKTSYCMVEEREKHIGREARHAVFVCLCGCVCLSPWCVIESNTIQEEDNTQCWPPVLIYDT